MSTKHTEGPWRCDRLTKRGTGERVITAPGLDPIAIVHNGNVCAEADARLIAASPLLLKSAKVVLAGLNARIDHANANDLPCPVFDGIADLHSAIRQAEEEPTP